MNASCGWGQPNVSVLSRWCNEVLRVWKLNLSQFCFIFGSWFCKTLSIWMRNRNNGSFSAICSLFNMRKSQKYVEGRFRSGPSRSVRIWKGVMKVKSLNYNSWIFLNRGQNWTTIGHDRSISGVDDGTSESEFTLRLFLYQCNETRYMKLQTYPQQTKLWKYWATSPTTSILVLQTCNADTANWCIPYTTNWRTITNKTSTPIIRMPMGHTSYVMRPRKTRGRW